MKLEFHPETVGDLNVEQGIRRYFVHRFPFSILYRIVDEKILRVLVIRHHRRHPEFGIQRNET